MKIYKRFNNQVVILLKNHGIGVIPTDTIYGLVGSVFSKKAVARIYKLRKRNLKKPMIILIHSLKDLEIFNIKLNNQLKKLLLKFWPGKVSIILSCPYKKFSYLYRSTKTLSFRLPAKISLVKLLKKTGPLVAPSANPEGLFPAKIIKEAREYFGKDIDFYVDGGKLTGLPSTLIQIKNNNVIIKRKGTGKNKNTY